MWAGLLWFALLTTALLSYPRRPRTSGILWIMLGTLSIGQSGASFGSLSGMFCIGIGVWYLVKYRDPNVRAKHVEYWTAKA